MAYTRRRDHQARPPSVGLVVDVGGGQAANPRADVVVDKYVADNFERGNALDLSKPLVVADAEALPFADGSFAYAIASHVLEHAIDPVKFAAELSRIAAAGFVQVPSRESELTFGWEFHPWLIDRDGEALVFFPRGDLGAPVGRMFHEAMAYSPLFQLWYASDRDRWHHSLEWEGSLEVRCEGCSRARATASFDVEDTRRVLEANAGRARGPDGEAHLALRCPVDYGELELEYDVMSCCVCDRCYPIVASVPILVEEAAL